MKGIKRYRWKKGGAKISIKKKMYCRRRASAIFSGRISFIMSNIRECHSKKFQEDEET